MSKCPSCGNEANGWVVYIGKTTAASVCYVCAAKSKKEQVSKLRVVRRDRVPLRVGMTTLVGYLNTSYPASSGNCCSLTHPYVDGKPTGPSYPCRNMNAENVDEAGKRWPELLQGVEIDVLEDGSCRVVDERLPAEWRKHFCSGCGYFEDDEREKEFMSPPPPEDGLPAKMTASWSAGVSKLEPGFIYSPYIPMLVSPKSDDEHKKQIDLSADEKGL